MDFASLMNREIAKSGSPSSPPKSITLSKAPATKKDDHLTDEAKYLKKADLEKKREDEYLQQQAAVRREKEEKASRKRQIEEDEAHRRQERDEKRRRLAEESRRRREEEEAKKERARRKRLGLPDLPSPSSKEGTPSKDDETSTAADQLSMTLTPEQRDLPIPTTLALLPEANLRVPATPPSDTSTLPHLYRQLTSYFTLLLRAWRDALAARPASVSSTTTGKQALAAYTTSLTNLRPLFQHFERSTLPTHLLAPLLEIVSAAQERRYVDANDAYLRLSIGKAAWPIGVTMVGIHERSAREKLSEGKGDAVAHIMADEGTRKWLQSLKRCLSFAQTRWPPEDVGQMMG